MEVNIDVKSTYDATAVQQAKNDLQQQQVAAQQAAAAAEQQAQAEQLLREQMELEAKGRAALIAELNRLAEARRKAAAAGETEQYQKLDAQIGRTRQAFEKLNQVQETANLGKLNQAQLGIQVADSLNNLAASAQNGTLSLGQMVGAIGSVSMAIKAGLGPIGWMMLAVQGLQMAWDAYTASQESSADIIERNNKEAEKWQKRQEERIAAVADANAKATQKIQATFQAEVEAAQQAQKQRESIAAAATARRIQDAEQEAALRRTQAEIEQQRIQAAQALGTIDKETAAARLAALREQIAADQQHLDLLKQKEQASNTATNADAAAEAAQQAAQAYEREFGRMRNAGLFSVDLPTEKEWADLQVKLYGIGVQGGKQALAALNDREEEILNKAKKITKTLADLGITTSEDERANLNLLFELRKHAAAAEKNVAALQAAAEAAEENANAEERALGLAEERAEAAATLRQAAAELAAAQQQAAEQEKQLAAIRQEQADDLRKIGDRFQTSRTYAEEDTRSQAAILAADKRILLRKRAELQNMLRTPGLDADVARDANAQLRAVNSQLRGLKQAEQRYAAERKAALADQLASLRQAKAPNLQGAWSHVQGSVKILAKAYERRARRIAAAAEKGDTKSVNRLIRAQENTARNMDRINHTGTQAQEYTAKAAAAARAVAAAKAKQKSGEEASAKASAAKAKSDKAAAASAQANAAAAKKAAAAAKAQSNKAKATKTTDLRPQLSAATAALSRAEATLRSIAELLPRLTSAADSIAATATNLAAGLTSRVAAAEARLKSLSALVTSLKRR